MVTSRLSRSAIALVILSVCFPLHAQQGVWKSLVPTPGSMNGEFQNSDPVGLAAGAEIKADCSLSWTDPADNKLYCFASGTSLQTFLEAPRSYITQARQRWTKLHPTE
jgi:hypothetical protein